MRCRSASKPSQWSGSMIRRGSQGRFGFPFPQATALPSIDHTWNCSEDFVRNGAKVGLCKTDVSLVAMQP